MNCKHEKFQSYSKVGRLANSDNPDIIIGYTVDVTITCMQCDMKFEWIGIPAGYSPNQPMTNFDGTELRAPIRPSTDPAEQVRVMLQQGELNPADNNIRQRLFQIRGDLSQSIMTHDIEFARETLAKLDKWIMDTADVKENEQPPSYGYLCTVDGKDQMFVIAENISAAMDILGKEHEIFRLDKHCSIPVLYG